MKQEPDPVEFLGTPRARFKLIQAKYRSKCIWCGERVDYSEGIMWAPSGSVHVECFQESHPVVAA